MFPLLLDSEPFATKAYSQEGFHTYVIDPQGIVRADLPGTKMKRPGPEKIMAAVEDARNSGTVAN